MRSRALDLSRGGYGPGRRRISTPTIPRRAALRGNRRLKLGRARGRDDRRAALIMARGHIRQTHSR